MEQPSNSMWIRAFTPDGYQVSFTFLLPEQDPIGFAALVVEELTKHNFNPRESSLEPGEQIVTVNQVLRREHVNTKSGVVTPVVEFWHNAGKYRTVQYYLNTAEDMQAFALATGITLDNYPLYEGEGSVERGKSPKAEAKLVAIQPIQIVMKTVEKEVDGAVQKRKYFVRFHSKGIPAPEFISEPKPSTQEVKEKLGSGGKRRINGDTQERAIAQLPWDYDTLHKKLKETGTFKANQHIANAIKEQIAAGNLPREATNEQAYEIVMNRNEMTS